MVDSAVVNAWKFSSVVNKTKMSQLDFKSQIAVSLIRSDSPQTVENPSVSLEETPSRRGRYAGYQTRDEVRFDRVGHLIVRLPGDTRKRCKECSKHTFFTCEKCLVNLHPECFKAFHTK